MAFGRVAAGRTGQSLGAFQVQAGGPATGPLSNHLPAATWGNAARGAQAAFALGYAHGAHGLSPAFRQASAGGGRRPPGQRIFCRENRVRSRGGVARRVCVLVAGTPTFTRRTSLRTTRWNGCTWQFWLEPRRVVRTAFPSSPPPFFPPLLPFSLSSPPQAGAVGVTGNKKI